MSVGFRGLLGAMWVTARALSLVGALLVVARWSAITRSPPNGDATPQLSFLLLVVLPLVAFVAIGLVRDISILLRQRPAGQRRNARAVLALTSALLLGAVMFRLFGHAR